MFYDVPNCLSANSGIESLYLKAAGQLADKGSCIGAREMIVRFLNSESLLDLDLSEDFIRDELADYFSPESDFAMYSKEALQYKASEVQEELEELLGTSYVREHIDCVEVLFSIATASDLYEEVVDIIKKRTAYYTEV